MIASHKPGGVGFYVACQRPQPPHAHRSVSDACRGLLHVLAILGFGAGLGLVAFVASLLLHIAAIRAGLI